MKVKYGNQTAIATITPANNNAGHEYDTLEDAFPTLDSSDAILVRKVVLNMNVESVDVAEQGE
jgi:hypothetical protein